MAFRYDPTIGGVKGSIGTGSSSSPGGFGGSSGGVYTKVGGSKALGGGSASTSTASTGRAASPQLPSFQMPTMPATPALTGPERPNLPPIDPTGQERPEHEALRERYTGFGEDLKGGTGFAMDVLTGEMTDRMEAQIEQAREQHAQMGIPFDADAYRAELQRGVNSAMAQEKLGREELYQQHLATTAPVTAGADYAQAEKGIDLERDQAEMRGVLERYGIDVSKYGTDVQAATRANEMLMDFYKTLMSGMMSGPSFGYTGNVSFG
jgi:hypothetical protein